MKIIIINFFFFINKISTVEQYAVRAFADALEQIPTCLAENSGLNPIVCVAESKAKQLELNVPRFGIDCLGEVIIKKKSSN